MADHYERAVDLLEEIDDLAEDLAIAYRANASREVVADIHAKLSRSLKLADIHATLSVAQRLEDTAMQRAAVPA